jgi:hypothetical protein
MMVGPAPIMHNPVKAFAIARRTLPLGHYARAEARARLDREYAESRVVEAAMARKYRKVLKRYGRCMSVREAANLVYKICVAIGTSPPRKIHVDDKSVTEGAGGEYRSGSQSIHVPYHDVPLRTLLHELAHHIVSVEHMRGAHGADFCMVTEIVWGVMAEFWRADEDLRKEAA